MADQRKPRRQGHFERGQGHEFGRDGISGLLSADRALRAREVSHPTSRDEAAADRVLASLLARVAGRRR